MRRKAPSPVLLILIACLFLTPRGAAAPGAPVTLRDQGDRVTLANGVISVTFHKADGTIPEMHLGDSPNLAGRGAYLAVANSGGHDGWDLHHAAYQVVRRTPDLIELSFGAPIGGVFFTEHYVLRRGDPGFYVFLEQTHRPTGPPERFGQTRWSFYLNPALFDYQLVNDHVQAPIPSLKGATTVQDATYRLPDGRVYTKYDYADYFEGHFVHGLCGSRPGSYGVFLVMGSNEYLGAPTRQDLTVHAGPIVHRFLQSGHFLPRQLAHPWLPPGWTKLCGPWFVYLNRGDTPQAMWADAKARAAQEQAQWPYQWMDHPDYPLKRGTVTGTLTLYHGRRPAAHALMVLTAPAPDWQLQILDYIWSARADAQGRFTLPHVRPGTYTLFAAVPGETDEFRRDKITVTAGGTVELGAIDCVPSYFSAKLWEIGYADRRTTGFRLSDRPRQYGLWEQVPADLTYTVGRSDPSRDWYYAQAKPGDWNVRFDMVRTYGGEGVLTVGVAGQTSDPKLEVLVNGRPVATITTAGNSSALYRSAVLGSSYDENKIVRFPASLLTRGTDTVTFRLSHGSIMYDVLKLEVDDPSLPRQIPPPSQPPKEPWNP